MTTPPLFDLPGEPQPPNDELLGTIRDMIFTWTEQGTLTAEQTASLLLSCDLLDRDLAGGGHLPAAWRQASHAVPPPPPPPRRTEDVHLPGL